MRKTLAAVATVLGLGLGAVPPAAAGTAVPGHEDKTSGIVMGSYDAVYAYDAGGAFYYDLGDGRVQASPGVSSIEDLDDSTLTVCDYRVVYQGDFGGDPFLDQGWIRNNVNCQGHDDNGNYNALYIHESDRRYTGEREAIWGDWEIFVDAVGGQGNVARPSHAVG